MNYKIHLKKLYEYIIKVVVTNGREEAISRISKNSETDNFKTYDVNTQNVKQQITKLGLDNTVLSKEMSVTTMYDMNV